MQQGAARLLRAPSSGDSTTLALGGAEVVAAFEVIRDELEVHERFKLRSVLQVPAPSEMAPEYTRGLYVPPGARNLPTCGAFSEPERPHTTDSSTF